MKVKKSYHIMFRAMNMSNIVPILLRFAEFLSNETNARNVQAVGLHANSIMATWDVSPYNCDVFGYRVHYYEVNNTDQKGRQVIIIIIKKLKI